MESLRWRALNQPYRRAITYLEDGESRAESLTYEELDWQARAIAAMLQRRNAAGERAILLFFPGLEYVTAILGCFYAGVVAVPAFPPRLNRPSLRIKAIAADAQASLVLTTTPILESMSERYSQTPELSGMNYLTTDEAPDDLAEDWQKPALAGDTLAMLQYTSGSTSAPKGVMVSHGNLAHNLHMLQCALADDEQSTFMTWLPLYHDMGLIGTILKPLYIGASVITMSPTAFLQRPALWLQALSRYRAHISGAPSFAYELCVLKITETQKASLDLSNWQLAFVGAEPVRAGTLERFATTFAPYGFRREAFYPAYGLAEATLFVSGGLDTNPPKTCAVVPAELEQDRVVVCEPEEPGAAIHVLCGHSWLAEEIVIVDPISRVPSPPDRIGEIWVSGPNVAQGYWNKPEETAQTFGAHLVDGSGPYLRTGDLGFMHEGELVITGRLKDLIIIDGRNHYPQDIELTVEQHCLMLRPGCSAAFSVDVADEERLVIVAEVDQHYRPLLRQQDAVTTNGSATRRQLDRDAVVKAMRTAVAVHHDLELYDVVLIRAGHIPKTSSGKIQRRTCREHYLSGRLVVWSSEDERTPSPA
ncbi:MAG: fatty acyl-AMP ligase [Chloroflexi bacterium]|nr:fatty acyl-AMP ligase [Chloroflexota bacterium]MCI0644121.1 fatty acyl-AMP ligase [Chloroflexota bacterium]MCI0731742.1 fatty acyl-AMP ligase [Chloroflexota bacterium]